MLNNLKLLMVALLCVPLLVDCTSPPKKERPPNIVFILADDLGYGELGSYGQQNFATPHIDKLASEGMRFTNFYAGNTVCGPSRCSMITGKHPGNASVRGNLAITGQNPLTLDRIGISKQDTTIGEVLKAQGYTTALCGKWHLEHYEDSLTTWPKHRGFDYVIRERWNVHLNKQRKAYREKTGVVFDYNYPYELWENGRKVHFHSNLMGDQDYSMDDIVTDRGIDFIKEHKDVPFFVFFSLKIPHSPETFAKDTGRYTKNDWIECERVHAVRIEYLDQLVGKINQSINALGLEENTIVIFSSDNGGHSEGANLEPEVDPCKHDYTYFNSNGGLRGYKRDLYEGGIRVPFIAKWSKKIQAGSTSEHIAAFWDLLPTFADISGMTDLNYSHDGISFYPEMQGKPQHPHDYLYWEYLDNQNIQNPEFFGFKQAVRLGDWKAVRYGLKSTIELYNLKNDPGEAIDIAQENPDLISKIDSIFRFSRTESTSFPYGGAINYDLSNGVVVVSP